MMCPPFQVSIFPAGGSHGLWFSDGTPEVAREVASAVCGAGGDFPKGWGGGSLEAINKIDRPRIIINHLYIYILIIMLIMFDDCDI